MKMIAVNGSPRKQWNTARLLEKVVEGAKSAGMDAKLVHDFKRSDNAFLIHAFRPAGGFLYDVTP